MATKDPETWMLERARAKLEQAERPVKSLTTPRRPGLRFPSWKPAADVFEHTEGLWVLLAIPGVRLETLTFEVIEERLFVTGDRALPRAFRAARVLRLEIPHGRFERTVELPPGRYEVVRHELVDGCLFFTLKRID